ncbi:SusC/RagA family TonB-linked outer membrane protein [Bacteroidia bacterium]|nr:SusC/RagA family TonB-linked outer membrane protein [Bacteroidia bacterium]
MFAKTQTAGANQPVVTQQLRSISGIIQDAKGEPVIGANVVEKGTTNGVITDIDGKFTLNVSGNLPLTVSYIGYRTQDVVVGNKTTFAITLVEDTQALEEVVVVGYGTQKKVNLTGAVSAVSGEALSGMPATNVVNMLQGKLPGVAITATNGQPGREGTSIRIRGVGTMNNADPMVLIDGLEASLNDVNPNDVENISVLKDAAAASIYGTRAANGVILVTTKRGKIGKPALTYNGYIGWQKAVRLQDHLSSAQYAELSNEARLNEGGNIIYTPEEIEKYRNGSDPDNFPNTDWIDALFQGSGFTHNHNVSLNGGTEATRYAVSLAYYNQEGLTKNTSHDRYTVRINLDSKVTDRLSFGVNSSLSRREITQPVSPYGGFGEFFRQANRIPNIFVNKYSDGTWGRHIDGNPIAWIESGGTAASAYSHALGSAFGEIKIIDGLTLKGVAGLDYSIDDGKTHVKEIKYGDGSIQGPNSVEDYLERFMTVTMQGLLNYEKQFGPHAVKGLLGVSRERYTRNLTRAYRRNFPSNDLTELNAGSTIGWTNSGTSNEATIGSYFGRINYDYAGKYLLEMNLRSDGSSKFAQGHRWGTFPSFSAGWRLSEESFMKGIEVLDNLKIRGSWGKLGNHRTDDYQYLAKIALGQNYNFYNGVVDGASQTQANNSLMTWETATETDFGIDAGIKDGLLSASVDYYDRYTDNILAVVPVSMIFGLNAPVSNAGAMRNRGVELTLGHTKTIVDFNYGVDGYVAFNKNKVEKYPNPSKGEAIRMEGYSWDAYYGYECIGIFMSNEEAASSPVHSPIVRAGDLKFKDQNGDGKIDADDRVVLGNRIPDITYGFNFSATYKGIDFLASFQGAAKVYRTIDGQSMWPFSNGSNPQTKHLDRTIVENGKVTKLGYYPKTLVSQTQNTAMSSFRVLNSSYLRLKNLQVGYNLPKNLLGNLGVNRARIYLSGQNLLTFTGFPKDVDPEVSSGGGSSIYPQVSIYTIGLDITF